MRKRFILWVLVLLQATVLTARPGYKTPVDVRSKTEEVRSTDNATYNLAGERVTEGYKGLVIKNGKKVVVK